MATISIPYTPRKWAETLHNSIKRWICLVLHRRAGKTTAILNHLQRDAIRVPGSQYAYIAPTYKQAKLIAWDILKTISRPIPGIEQNASELKVTYPNGSKVMLLGSENPDALRGMALWGGGQDEASQQPSNLFSEIISKALADHLGYWLWAGTPKGKNEFYRTYQTAKNNPNEWTYVLKTIDDSLREEEGQTIENLRIALEDDRRLVQQGQMTEEEFNQEWYCSFEAAIKGAYYASQIAEARKQGRIKVIPYDQALKVHSVWDLGIGQALGIGFYQKLGGELKMIDYWEGMQKDGIPQAIKALQNKPYVYGKHFLPHDAEGTSESTGETRVATARKLWPATEFEIIPKLSIDDGINKGRLMFSHLWIDEKNCQIWLDYISQYKQEWDDRRGMFLEKPYHDFTSHAADVHRYAAIVEDRMSNEVFKSYKQVPAEPISIYG